MEYSKQLERIQVHFKNKIADGKYHILNVAKGHLTLWIELMIDMRPFCIKINRSGVIQDGDISENYIQLGTFNKQQQNQIYEREYKRHFAD